MKKMNYTKLRDLVYKYDTKHKEGFTNKEITQLLSKFPDVDQDKFDYEQMGNTCMLIDDKVINYHVDVLRALRAGLGEKIHPLEWD